MFADFNYVVVLQEMLLDWFPVYERAVGRVKILDERVIQDGNDGGVFARYRQIVNRNIIVGFSAERSPLFTERDLLQDRTVDTQDQFCHSLNPKKFFRSHFAAEIALLAAHCPHTTTQFSLPKPRLYGRPKASFHCKTLADAH